MDNNTPDGAIILGRRYDGWYKTTGQKTIQTGFRVYATQLIKLKQDYNGNASALVRLLLEEYFDGKLPELEKKFKKEIGL